MGDSSEIDIHIMLMHPFDIFVYPLEISRTTSIHWKAIPHINYKVSHMLGLSIIQSHLSYGHLLFMTPSPSKSYTGHRTVKMKSRMERKH